MKKNFIKITTIFILLFLSILTLSTKSFAEANQNLYKYKSIEDKINAEGRARVIIVFEKEQPTQPESKVQSKQSKSKSGVNSVNSVIPISSDVSISEISGFEKRTNLDIINGYGGTLTREGLEELKAKGLNVKIYEDKVLHINDNINTNNSLNYGLLTSFSELSTCTATVNADYSWNTLNLTGRNITVAILDTGVDYTHVDLGGCFGNGTDTSCKVFDGYDFYNRDGRFPMDTHNHGTFIAGIISANGSMMPDTSTAKGVAPESRLYALKVCDNNPNNPDCLTSDIIDAINWSIVHSADIISISLGSYPSSNDVEDEYSNTGKDPLSQAIDAAFGNGTIVVNSAGNNGPGTSTINNPASSEKTITVGAVDTHESSSPLDDSIWVGSSRGPSAFGRLDPEMVAPGADYIRSIVVGNISAFMGPGTSFATPFVAGAAALLLEQNPSLTPSQVRAILMQSAVNISGKLFERGAGELDIRNALTGKVYAMVNHVNPYGITVDNDRWEFIVTPYSTNYANITIFNDNNYNISLSSIIDSIENMENNITLNTTQLKIQSSINISNNTNITIQINFTLDNFDTTYATTYGGLVILNGSGYNGTANVSKSIRIPVVITVPIRNFGYVSRTLQDNPSGYYYCYYNTAPRNTVMSINWSNADDWISLYLYNSTGDFISKSNNSGVNTQSISTANTNTLKWLRIDGYQFVPSLMFNMNITSSNSAPIITNISAVNGSSPATNTLLFYRPNNLTINISYTDADNDIVNVSINDSGYTLISNSSNSSSGYALFRKLYTPDLDRNTSIIVSLTDPYGGITTQTITVLLYTSILINSYTPTSSTIYLSQNDSMNFTVDANDTGGKTLYYYWFVNTTLNITTQNPSFLFNATSYSLTSYLVKAFISNNNTNNDTNETVSWNVYIDRIAPSVTIQSPVTLLNYSNISINYTMSDALPSSGINNCWYNINGTNNETNYTINSTLDSCMNTSIYLGNGLYTLRVYANDTVGNNNYTVLAFRINDTVSPVMTNAAPQGQQPSYVTNVILTVYTDENATCKYDTQDIAYDSMTGLFYNFVTQHNVTYSVTAGGHTVYVRCSDMSNNTNNESIQIAFTIPSPPSGGNPGTGGSSGGGGSMWSDAIMVSKDFDVLIPGQNNMSIYSQNIPVSQVSVNMSAEEYNATLTVSVIDAPVENPLDALNESIFSYLSINLTALYLEALRGTEIYFGVTQKWLKDNNITKDDVVMLRYNESTTEWDMLFTELLNENEVSVYYVAHSPALGMFVISYNRTSTQNATPVEEPEINTTRNESTIQKLHSEGDASSLNNSRLPNKEKPNNTATRAESMLWIVWVLSGTFIFIVVVLLIIKGMGTKHYENELIMATDNEFKQANKELAKKVPKIPEDLEAISKEVSEKLSAELSKSVNKSRVKKKP